MALHAIENAMRGPRTHGRMKFDLSVHENFFVSACASNNYNFLKQYHYSTILYPTMTAAAAAAPRDNFLYDK